MNRLPAASGLLIAYRWASAQSLTSTQANYTLGIAGTLPLINCSMISPDENPAPTNAGPSIRPGLIVASSNR